MTSGGATISISSAGQGAIVSFYFILLSVAFYLFDKIAEPWGRSFYYLFIFFNPDAVMLVHVWDASK